jgi:hypothetical protein
MFVSRRGCVGTSCTPFRKKSGKRCQLLHAQAPPLRQPGAQRAAYLTRASYQNSLYIIPFGVPQASSSGPKTRLGTQDIQLKKLMLPKLMKLSGEARPRRWLAALLACRQAGSL